MTERFIASGRVLLDDSPTEAASQLTYDIMQEGPQFQASLFEIFNKGYAQALTECKSKIKQSYSEGYATAFKDLTQQRDQESSPVPLDTTLRCSSEDFSESITTGVESSISRSPDIPTKRIIHIVSEENNNLDYLADLTKRFEEALLGPEPRVIVTASGVTVQGHDLPINAKAVAINNPIPNALAINAEKIKGSAARTPRVYKRAPKVSK